MIVDSVRKRLTVVAYQKYERQRSHFLGTPLCMGEEMLPSEDLLAHAIVRTKVGAVLAGNDKLTRTGNVVLSTSAICGEVAELLQGSFKSIHEMAPILYASMAHVALGRDSGLLEGEKHDCAILLGHRANSGVGVKVSCDIPIALPPALFICASDAKTELFLRDHGRYVRLSDEGSGVWHCETVKDCPVDGRKFVDRIFVG